jgi:uncharacterized RDD family membrane protein YckC
LDYILIVILAILILICLAFSFPIADFLSDWSKDLAQQLEENSGDPQAINAFLLPTFLIIIVLVSFGEVLYFTFWELATGGRSFGKLIVKLRVIERNGMPLTFRSSVIRNLLRLVDVLPSSYAIGLISLVLSDRNQRLGDLAAGTVVIRINAFEAATAVATDPDLAPLPLSRGQLTRLGTTELSLARGALRRSDKVPVERAQAVLSDAVAVLRERLELEDDLGEDAKRFLERVVVTAQQDERRR